MKSRAFSLIELVVTLTAIGVLGSLAFAAVGHLSERSARLKLEADVDTLNRATSSYLAMGGSLTGAQSPAEVIARLKSTSAASEARRTAGLTASFVDPRLGVTLSRDAHGVIWNPGRQRFELDGDGAGAVAAFTLDDALAEIPATEESRQRTVSYARESTWIWDYRDREVTHAPGPTEFVIVNEADTGATGLPASTPAPTPKRTLTPPRFSIPAGIYDIREFDLPVTLANPNPDGSSKIVYAIDYGNWQDYTTPLALPPGSVLSAQAVSNHARWGDSAKIDQDYEARPAPLAPPAIETDHPSLGKFSQREVLVTLANPNSTDVSRLEYRIESEDWLPYAAPFSVTRAEFEDGVAIEARAVPIDSPYYLASSLVRREIPVIPFEASGQTSGQFVNASGSTRMVTSLELGDPSDIFAWGEVLPVNNANHTDQSRLAFTGATFTEVAPDQSFRIGSLAYYNGTILSGTGADRVDLTVQLDLSINGILFRPDFTFSFDLINTTNSSDAWASADIVRISDPIARQSLVINDYEYQFEIEFGRSSAAGYALFDEFHVLEDAAASAEIFGTLLEMGQVAL